mmetsp:Transcript_35189/g.69412  ORF Transcript_35189/g.69412 Transcript_35189/m.69412 type:complete len:87 (+) Transcript_35189:804-1064(+)
MNDAYSCCFFAIKNGSSLQQKTLHHFTGSPERQRFIITKLRKNRRKKRRKETRERQKELSGLAGMALVYPRSLSTAAFLHVNSLHA